MSTRIGTATRNTLPQWKCASSAPPTSGPSALPAANIVDQTASAIRRSPASTNTLRMIESVAGMSIAPNTPIAMRAATSIQASVAKAAATENSAKPVAPITRIRRRPMRSPMLPITTSRPASTSGYASTIQSCVVASGFSARLIDGSAKLRMVLSTEMSRTGSMSTASARNRRARLPVTRVATGLVSSADTADSWDFEPDQVDGGWYVGQTRRDAGWTRAPSGLR